MRAVSRAAGAIPAIAWFHLRGGLGRRGVLVAIAAASILAALLLPPADADYVTMRFNNLRPLYSSEFIGFTLAVVGSMVLMPVFYVLLRNALPVAEQPALLITSSPVSMPAFFMGRALADAALMGVVLTSLAAGGVVLQIIRGEVPFVQPHMVLLPLLLVGLPVFAMVGGARAILDALPLTRGRIGDAVFVVLWLVVMSNTAMKLANDAGLFAWLGDPLGVARAFATMPMGGDKFSIGIVVMKEGAELTTFPWSGFAWTDPSYVASRISWFLIGLGLAGVAGLLSNRLRGWGALRLRRSAERVSEAGVDRTDLIEAALAVPPAPRAAGPGRLLRLMVAELRLCLHGKAWLLLAAGLIVAGLKQPPDVAMGKVLPLAIAICVFRLGDLGVRASGGGLAPVSRALPMPWMVHMLVGWLVGTVLLLIAASGVLATVAGDPGQVARVLTILAGTSAAAMLGARLTGSTTAFAVGGLIYCYMLLSAG